MQYLGVITDPGKQSTSPAFQQAAIDALGLGIVYERWPTSPDGLATRVIGLRAPSVLGANVTIPHKEAVMPMLDELDALAQRVGAVNTILNREGRLSGYNTDVEGSLRALRDDAAFDPRGCHAVIAGAGGAARAVVVALIEAGAGSIAVLNRSAERAQRLVDDLSPHAGGTWLEALPAAPGSWGKIARRAQLLVNCTSVGMADLSKDESPVPSGLIRPEMLVSDLIYRPLETRLLRDARASGACVLGGLPMLVYQGAASFKIWTGQEAPIDIMLDAARKALAEAA
ncbi:MAG: shikimate dehydrogenase [Chloroflexota bacterium]|nr:shikimate dehydrogenase [Chloroflexota bacterium]